MNKILIIDDEEVTRLTFSDLLRQYQFATLEAHDGREGISILARETPDAVLLDLQMPGMDGIETMQEMRKIDPDVPIIFMTAQGDIPTAADAVKLGAFDFIVKPPDDKMLILALNRALGKLRQKRQSTSVVAQCRETEAKFRALAERIPAITYSAALDELSSTLSISPQVEDLTGFGPEEWIKDPKLFVKQLHPDDRERVLAEFSGAKASGKPVTCEYRLITKDGRAIWCRDDAVLVKDEAGNPLFLQGIMFDVTKRKQAEEEINRLNEELGQRVIERTAQLEASNRELMQEIVIRKQAEDSLKEKTRLTEIFLDRFSCVALLLRPHSREVVISNEAAVKAGAVPGKTCYGTWGQRENPCPWCLAPALWATGEAQHLEVEALGTVWDAHWIPVSHDVYMHYAFDITERKGMERALRNSEAHYRAIVDSFDGFIYECSQDYRVEFMNEKFIQRTGRNAVGELCYDVMHDRDSVCPWCVNGRVFRGETVRWEVRSPKDNRWYYCVNTPIHHADGSMSKQAMIIDITERKKAEEALKENEHRISDALEFNNSILKTSSIGVLTYDAAGQCIFANEAAAEIAGTNVAGLLLQNFHQVQSWKKTGMYEAALRALNTNIEQHTEVHVVTTFGKDIWLSLRFSSFHSKGEKHLLVFTYDITERKLAEEALQQYARELKNLSSRLVDIQETERRYVARELHDEIGQALTGIKLNLEAHSSFPGRRKRKSLDEAQKMVSDLMDRVRDMSLSLRPSMLDDLGLLPTLLWHFRKYTAHTDIHITFKYSCMDSRFEPEVETAAYRVVQEALTNVARHASVKEAEVILTGQQDALMIQIEDKGAGFDPEAVTPGRHCVGLSGMRERIDLLGGRMRIESSPGNGTRLQAEIPLRDRDQGKKEKA